MEHGDEATNFAHSKNMQEVRLYVHKNARSGKTNICMIDARIIGRQ